MVALFTLPDGAQLGYVILGEKHLKDGVVPLVIINGMSMRFEDWDVISKPLSERRTGESILGKTSMLSGLTRGEQCFYSTIGKHAATLFLSLHLLTIRLDT